MAIAALIPALAPILGKVVGNLFPDPEERAKAEREATAQLLAHSAELEQAAAGIINTEAASKHWLAANWRPLMMVTFGAIIVARFMGWTAPGISDAEYENLWTIMQIGIGGYVVGRSVEKVGPRMVESWAKGKAGGS